MLALSHRLARASHVVAEVIEAQLGVSPIGDVTRIGRPLGFRIGDVWADPTHAQAQPGVELAHPLRVSGGEVVVDRDHVDAATVQGVEVSRQGRDQGLALTGAHLRDPAEVKCHAAHDLDVEVALPENPPCRLTHHGICLDQEVVERLPLVESSPELDGLGLELLVAECLHGWLEGVDHGHELRQTTNLLAFTGAQDFRENAHDQTTLPGFTPAI